MYIKTKGYNLLCNKIETIALRGSTADYGFQPNIIDNSYNLVLQVVIYIQLLSNINRFVKIALI